MKKDLTEVVLILDESGSMQPRVGMVKEGYEEFIKIQQQIPGEVVFTFVKFDTKYDLVYDGIDIRTISSQLVDYQPGGMTALLDAVGKTIDAVGKRLSNTDESLRPEKVIFCIITDGEENSSKEYTLHQIKDKIKEQDTVYNWQFIFIGSNQDAWEAAGTMNIGNTGTGNSTAVNYNDANIKQTMSAASVQIGSSRRSKNKMDINSTLNYYAFSQDDLEREVEKLKNSDE